MLSPVLFRVST